MSYDYATRRFGVGGARLAAAHLNHALAGKADLQALADEVLSRAQGDAEAAATVLSNVVQEVTDLIAPKLNRVGGDASAVAVMAEGSTVPRLLSERFGEVANILDFAGADATGVADCGPAIIAAHASLPATGGVIHVPPGVYRLSTPVVLLNKPVAFRCAGKKVVTFVQTHTGAGITIQQDFLDWQVTFSGCRAVSTASAAVSAFLSIGYAELQPSYGRGTVRIEDVEFVSGGEGTAAGSFSKGIRLTNCWSPRLIDVIFTGRYASPAIAGTCAIDLSECFDAWIEGCAATYGESLVRQSGYCEGIRLINPTCVGCDWLMVQNEASIVTRAGRTLNGLWLTGGEVNTQRGGLKIARSLSHMVQGTHWTRWGNSGLDYRVYDYIDTFGTTHAGDMMGSGIGTDRTAIRLISQGGDCQHNVWHGPMMANFDLGAYFGPSVARSAVIDARLLNGPLANAFVDDGYNNQMNWQSELGAAQLGNRVISGASGQTLVVIPNVVSAVNILAFVAASAGLAPALYPDGEANAGLEISAKGTGRLTLGRSGEAMVGVGASSKVGFYGHVPVVQPAAPNTLADVIAILRGCGLAS